MASFSELFDIRNDSSLRNRITTAVAIQAETIRKESPDSSKNYVNRLIWARQAFQNPEAKAAEMLWGVLAGNKALAAGAVKEATDDSILATVADLVDTFAIGT